MALNRSIVFGSPPNYGGPAFAALASSVAVSDSWAQARGLARSATDGVGVTDSGSFQSTSQGLFPDAGVFPDSGFRLRV